MYLFLALFWVAVAVVVQFFWDDLERHAYIPLHRNLVGFFCFVLFSYNFIRWRLQRARWRSEPNADELPPRPRVAPDEYNPALDFSDKPMDDAGPAGSPATKPPKD